MGRRQGRLWPAFLAFLLNQAGKPNALAWQTIDGGEDGLYFGEDFGQKKSSSR